MNAEWNADEWSLKINDSNNQERIKCSIDFNSPTMSEYLINLTNRDNSIIMQEHDETVQTETNATIDYRYVGANPNNYVCLEESGKCIDDQLYRIIGVIPTQKDESGEYEDRVKLVKYTSIGDYYWMGNADAIKADWSQSTLNTQTLNEEYWNQIKEYHPYIEEAKWYVGNAEWGATVLAMYKSERALNTYVVTKIGMLYPSDYGYATSGQDDLTRTSCIESAKNNLWIDNFSYCNQNDWLYGNNVHLLAKAVSSTWRMQKEFPYVGGFNTTTLKEKEQVMPSFYLSSKVKYSSGTGTKDNPYRVMIDQE